VEQLQAHYTKWKSNLHVKEALSLSSSARNPLSHLIHDVHRSNNAPPVAERSLDPYIARSAGLLQLEPPSSTVTHSMACEVPPLQPQGASSPTAMVAESESSFPPLLVAPVISPTEPPPSTVSTIEQITQTTTNPLTAPPLPTEPHPSADWQSTVELLSRKRVLDGIAQAKSVKRPRKSRTCRKCSIPECSGRQKVDNCKNPCQDCSKRDCRGRNPKRLDKQCWNGWPE